MNFNLMITSKQKYHFCTIFNYGYFSKGLALYQSLDKVCDCTVYVFTPDEKCKQELLEKNYPNLIVIEFAEFEDKRLLEVKSKRDTAEYFWTVKGACLEYLLQKYNMDAITYVDADTYFYSTPEPMFDELENKSVLILPHNFSPQYKHEIVNGTFNAGYITFKNDKNGLSALKWWKEKSIEWCYRKKKDGKFGDQMYLDEMIKFPGVHSIQHKGGLANWNVQQYDFFIENNELIGKTNLNETFRVIFYHFHYLKFFSDRKVEFGRKFISEKVLDIFYKPYINYLLNVASWDAQGASNQKFSIKDFIITILRKLKRTYNIFSIESLK
jgi:hypothetical protein